ncbi:hypothetical protein U27_03323 [Candidatus Vecturithrix granuli]|uniref:Uncharacterized protein n=1 Tax=Vecturithrix granuli TaxID=1499967 RepID=A0A081BVK6_VECG1|nr:hypothetical protein U27_03323 [Candidatus Vecturithrix granuli]
MAQTSLQPTTLAQAVTSFVDAIHRMYAGIAIRTVSNYEDEDLAFEITIPPVFSREQVLETCNRACITIEDEYDVFILPIVVYAQ